VCGSARDSMRQQCGNVQAVRTAVCCSACGCRVRLSGGAAVCGSAAVCGCGVRLYIHLCGSAAVRQCAAAEWQQC
jgi:hypothetical protein